MNKRILFIGVPGSGKGTQAELLIKYGFKHICTGDIMREAWKNNDPLVLPYKKSVENGGLLPDNVVFELINRGVKNFKDKNYILDGAVRTLNQAKIALSENLFDEVFFFDLTENEAVKRLIRRSATAEAKRKDDDPKAVKKRFQEYKKQTQQVLDYLRKNVKRFHALDASLTIEKIHNDVKRILRLK